MIPGLSATGLSEPAVRRAWAALGQGDWSSSGLLRQWRRHVEQAGVWQAHEYEGYRPVAVDVTGFWRPRLQGCATSHYHGPAGKALPAIPVGMVARIGSVGTQRQGQPLAIVVHPEHPLTGAQRVAPGDLQRETLLLTRPGCGYRALFTAILAAAGVRTSGTLDFGSVEAIKQCVAAGVGIAALPRAAVAAELADGRLVALTWSGPPLEVATQLLWHPAKLWSSPLRAFLEIARSTDRSPDSGDPPPDSLSVNTEAVDGGRARPGA